LTENIIYLKGKATGYFLPIEKSYSGTFHFYDIDYKYIEIKDCNAIDEIDLETLKIGFFSAQNKTLNDTKLFINVTEYITENISEVLFTDIEKGEHLVINNEKYFNFQATIYFKVRKPLIGVKQNKLLENSNLDGVDKKSSLFEKVINILNPFSSLESNLKKSVLYFFSIVLLLIFFGFLFIFVKKLTVISFISFILFLYFLTILNSLLKNKFTSYRDFTVIRWPILNLLGSLLLIFSLYSLNFKSPSFTTLCPLFMGASLLFFSRKSKIIWFVGLICLLISVFLFSKIANLNTDDNKEEHEIKRTDDNPYLPEEKDKKIIDNNKDTIQVTYLIHKLNWRDNFKQYHSGVFKVRKDFVSLARLRRNAIEVNESSPTAYYNAVYNKLINQNKDFLNEIIDEYKRIGSSKKLSKSEFTDMVVTSIQNIPYYLVHDLSHEQADEQYGGFISEYHQTGKPCLDNIKFGLQSPAEFMGDFKGDCDTRSVMLYYVLNNLGIKTVVLASQKYSHAIIGVSGNYSGDCVKSNGLKYYVWETTATGFSPGHISPQCSNMRYWSVTLN